MPVPPVGDAGGLLLVPDVGPDRGLGHLHRSLALGEAWAAVGGDVTVLVPETAVEAMGRIRAAGATAEPTAGSPVTPAEIARAANDQTWTVLDGYEHGAEHRAAAHAADHVAVIDDHGRTGAADVDVVIDHNPGASAGPYLGDALVLAGAAYTLVPAGHRHEPAGSAGDRLVIVMGGSPDGETSAFVDRVLPLLGVPAEQIDVVGLPEVNAAAGGRRIGRDDPLGLVFREARVALSAAGSTTWELASAGVASVLVAIADNQVPVGTAAAEMGVARFLGPVGQVAPDEAAAAVNALWSDEGVRGAMAARGPAVIDGSGPARVVAALRSRSVALRPATAADARLLWTWANEPQVRAMAFSSDPIDWDDHLAWLADRLSGGGSWIYVAGASGEGGPWGQVRFDRVAEGEVDTDVSIDARHRGRRLGAPLLAAATERLRADCVGLRRVHARVRRANRASAAAFWLAGFRPVGCEGDVWSFEWVPS
jgi:spore coat polysaccharide biosynthesis predicted glycosyltransferase SpsG/RimJ/RimL family protein N-acetyltransferase